MSFGEALEQIVLVLIHALCKVAGHTGIQCPVTFAREYIDVTIMHSLPALASADYVTAQPFHIKLSSPASRGGSHGEGRGPIPQMASLPLATFRRSAGND